MESCRDLLKLETGNLEALKPIAALPAVRISLQGLERE